MSRARFHCRICGKEHPTRADAARCVDQGTPARKLPVGVRVYPRYVHAPTGATVLARRLVKGTHAYEYQMYVRASPDRPRRRVWVPGGATFATERQRTAAIRAENRATLPLINPMTSSLRATYRAGFQVNRAVAAAWQAQGLQLVRYLCRSAKHGRSMAFFALATDEEPRCPACGTRARDAGVPWAPDLSVPLAARGPAGAR